MDERKRLKGILELAKDELLVWQRQVKDWMAREQKERQRKDHVSFLLDEPYKTMDELKEKVARLEDEAAKGKKTVEDEDMEKAAEGRRTVEEDEE